MSNLQHKKFLIGIVFGFFVVFIGGVTFDFLKKEAIPETQAFSFGLPFGGPILYVRYDCCNGIIVGVNNYNLFPTSVGPKELLFTTGSRLFQNYQIGTPGICTNGDAIPVGICQMYESYPTPCSNSSRLDGTITIVGTNLSPTMCVL